MAWFWQSLLRAIVCGTLVFFSIWIGGWALRAGTITALLTFLYFIVRDPATMYRRIAAFCIILGAAATLGVGWDISAKIAGTGVSTDESHIGFADFVISFGSSPVLWAGPAVMAFGVLLAIVDGVIAALSGGPSAGRSEDEVAVPEVAVRQSGKLFRVTVVSEFKNRSSQSVDLTDAVVEMPRWRDRILVDRHSVDLERVTVRPTLYPRDGGGEFSPLIPRNEKQGGIEIRGGMSGKVRVTLTLEHAIAARCETYLLLWPFLLLLDMQRICLTLMMQEAGNSKAIKAQLGVVF